MATLAGQPMTLAAADLTAERRAALDGRYAELVAELGQVLAAKYGDNWEDDTAALLVADVEQAMDDAMPG